MSTNLSALFESANLGELSVGRSLRTGALAIIADGDTVICEFPGEHNFCTEHPEYAQLFVAALNAMPKLLDENYKFKHQVRDTCVRAENAEKSLRAQPAGGGESLSVAQGQGWLPIESAPRDGTPILLGYINSHAEEGFWMGDASRNHWNETGWYATGEDVLCEHPSHPDVWQPLPAAPAQPDGVKHG